MDVRPIDGKTLGDFQSGGGAGICVSGGSGITYCHVSSTNIKWSCAYCGSEVNAEKSNCPNCGAPKRTDGGKKDV